MILVFNIELINIEWLVIFVMAYTFIVQTFDINIQLKNKFV